MEAKRLEQETLAGIIARMESGEGMTNAEQRAVLSHALALSVPTPEAVARHYEEVASYLNDDNAQGMDALARLREGAVRAEVLETECERRTCLAEDAAKKWDAEVKRAESDLAAARQEVETFRTALASEKEANAKWHEEGQRLRARVATLEREEQTAREASTIHHEDFKRERARAEAAERRVKDLEEQLDAATCTLEDEQAAHAETRERLEAVESALSVAGVDASVRLKSDDEESEEHTDAASRVQWLAEAWERVKKQRAELLAGGTEAIPCDCRRPARYGTHPRADCTVCGGSGYLRHRAGYYPTPPAPAPLVEAVRQEALSLVETLRAFATADAISPPTHSLKQLHAALLVGLVDSLAAHDAAKGGEATATQRCPGCGRTWTRPTRCGDCDRNTVGLDTPPPEPGGGERNDSTSRLDWTPDGRTVRTNLGTPPAPLTPESLTAVVEAYAAEQMERSDRWEHAADNARNTDEEDACSRSSEACFGRADGAREVLRRALSGQVPRVIREERVVEVVQTYAQKEDSVYRAASSHAARQRHRGRVEGATAVLASLGLTLPATDPAMATTAHHGGNEVPSREFAADGPTLIEQMAMGLVRPAQPREATVTPTPEGPPLATLKVRAFGADGREILPEPAAPVAWEGDGVRVLANGMCLVYADDGWVDEREDTAMTLARALAEAKRDLADERQAHADDVASLERVRERLTKARQEARTAAEDMRERAEVLLYEAATQTRHPEQRDRLLSLGHAIRNLTLPRDR